MSFFFFLEEKCIENNVYIDYFIESATYGFLFTSCKTRSLCFENMAFQASARFVPLEKRTEENMYS